MVLNGANNSMQKTMPEKYILYSFLASGSRIAYLNTPPSIDGEEFVFQISNVFCTFTVTSKDTYIYLIICASILICLWVKEQYLQANLQTSPSRRGGSRSGAHHCTSKLWEPSREVSTQL